MQNGMMEEWSDGMLSEAKFRLCGNGVVEWCDGVEWWSDGGMEWWNSGVVEWWSGGMMVKPIVPIFEFLNL